MLRCALTLVALVVSPLAAADWTSCDHTAKRDLDLPLRGIERVLLRTQAGDLEVQGGSGDALAIRGTACASDAGMLGDIRLEHVTRGEDLIVTVVMPEAGSGWNEYRWLDLAVTLPATLAVDIEDSSGDIEVTRVAALRVQDSSGDVEVREVAGAVVASDTSGDLEVRDVGSVEIEEDSSGDITLEGVRGDAFVRRDGSGDVEMRDVQGDAAVRVDSSGDLRFDRIAGSVLVDSDSSGGIVAQDVGRDFTVRRDGSGSIRHDNVRGRVDIPNAD